MNRPIDYEHPFARLVPNDIVTPTTEVVKEEPEISEKVKLLPLSDEKKECIKAAFKRIMKDYKPFLGGEEPQTGWRFLGFVEKHIYCHGEFTVGKIYQQSNPHDREDPAPQFIDDNEGPMFEDRASFEEVK